MTDTTVQLSRLGAKQKIGYAPAMDNSVSDERLMLEYGKGTAQAFDVLYDRHRGPLYRYVIRRISNRETANELYQDIWERVIKSRKKYKPKAKFTTWLYQIAHNRIIDQYRKQKPETDIEQTTLIDPSDDMTESIHQQQSQQRLQQAIERLPEEQRDTLLLRMEACFDLNQIAEITGVSYEAAKSRLRYAVNKLKQEMAGD